MSVNPVLLRWVIGAIGSAVIAGVTAVMQLEQFDRVGVLVALGSAAGGALLGSLKTFPGTVRKEHLPKWMQDFLNGDPSSVPPLAPGFLEPAAQPTTTPFETKE